MRAADLDLDKGNVLKVDYNMMGLDEKGYYAHPRYFGSREFILFSWNKQTWKENKMTSFFFLYFYCMFLYIS